MGNIREWLGEKLVLVTKPSLSYMESGYSRFQRENREGRDREAGLSAPRWQEENGVRGGSSHVCHGHLSQQATHWRDGPKAPGWAFGTPW